MKQSSKITFFIRKLSILICGILFGVGFASSGMTDTEVVIGFLNVFGRWNASLLLTIVVACAVTFIGLNLISKMEKPLLGSQFNLLEVKENNDSLVLGSILFGIGWGLYGYCPGPAVTSLIYLSPATLIFVIFMTIGSLLANKLINYS